MPGFNDTQMNDPVVPALVGDDELHDQCDDIPRGEPGERLASSGRLRAERQRRQFCTAGFPVNPVANRLTNGLAGLPSLFPDANVVDSSYYQYEALNEVGPENFDGTRVLFRRRFSGAAGSPRARTLRRATSTPGSPTIRR